MVLPSFLPDWVPWWVQLAILFLALLLGVALLLMPFAVFGVKGRLAAVEAQLDDLGAEIRMLAARVVEPDPRPLRPPPGRAAEEAPVSRAAPAAPPPPAVWTAPDPRTRAAAPMPRRPVDPRYDPAARDEEPEPPRPRASPPATWADEDRFDRVPSARDDESWAPEPRAEPRPEPRREERPAPSRDPLRAPVDRDRDRDPDRLRYSGRPERPPRGGSGEREEPVLRWPPR